MSYICVGNPNTEGCLNGNLYCNDPRCFPYCRGCAPEKESETIGAIVVWSIILTLFLLFIILVIAYGPRFVGYEERGVIVLHDTNGDWMDEPNEEEDEE